MSVQVVTKGDQYDCREKEGEGDVRNLGKPVALARRYYEEVRFQIVRVRKRMQMTLAITHALRTKKKNKKEKRSGQGCRVGPLVLRGGTHTTTATATTITTYSTFTLTTSTTSTTTTT